VKLADGVLPGMHSIARLAVLVATGGVIYGGWMFAFARERIVEVMDLARRKG
jgi:hypothetical protein